MEIGFSTDQPFRVDLPIVSSLKPAEATSQPDRSLKFIRAAYAWLVFAMVMLPFLIPYGVLIRKYLHSDNGPEFMARELRTWLDRLGTGTLYLIFPN